MRQVAIYRQTTMNYLSVCSGIEAATMGWHHMGWTPVAFSEIEPFPSAVLQHHYPNVPNWGDMTKYKTWPDATIDLLVGGTPCQSFSVAGLRQGLKDPRGNLMLTFLGIADRYRPQWIVWENVPGVLSSNGGKDFGSFLGALGELGYGWAYRVLDAQWFGVAQRRRRVFVVGCLGDQRRAAQVLFESEGVSRHPAPSRAKGQGATANAQGSVGEGSWWDGGQTAATLTKQNANGAQRMPDKDNFGAILMRQREGCDGGGKGPLLSEEQSLTLATSNDQVLIQPMPINGMTINKELKDKQMTGVGEEGDPMFSIRANGQQHAVAQPMQVRRLTPVECERLQGFPIVREMLYLSACLDPTSGSVDVALKCHKLQSSAWPADASELMRFAATAESNSSAHHPAQEPLALVRVLMHSEAKVQELRSAGRLIWSAKNADEQSRSPQPTRVAAIAHALAHHAHVVAKEATDGREVSQQSISGSSPQKNGEASVRLCIAATKESANGAENVQGAERRQYTTSVLGHLTQQEGSTLTTALCSVLHAIAGCIPEQTLPESFCIAIEVGRGFTNIPWKKKPDSPDGPRYKALGNSMAVPCMRWIGERINSNKQP